MRNSQKGVSLIAVLMFMLVATIAATATYKWLGSSGSSSSSRMMQSEARQAALAGIESARSWMTYHGNETGAIIKQYFANNKQPIKLNSVMDSISNSKQSYSVYLVGADVSSSTYRIKLSSVGKSRDGSKYTESAILKVNGLYRVKVPAPKSSAKYEYSYFGGSTSFAGNKTATAMVINGNWSGNPGNITNDFIVTGDASLSGNNISVGATACIGGKANVDNGMTAGNLYIEEEATNFKSVSVSGDAYFDGTVAQSTGYVKIGGSMTANAHITTAQNAGGYDFTIGKNMCLGENGVIESQGTNATFVVGENVWSPYHNAIYYGSASWYQDTDGSWKSKSTRADNYSSYDKIILGNSTDSKVYVADGYPYANYVTLRENKKVTEITSNKSCKQNVQTNCTFGLGGSYSCTGNYDGCASWASWTGSTYYPYVSVDKKDNLYYFYYVPGESEVSFKKYDNSYWKHLQTNVMWGGYYSYYTWVSPTEIGAYHVGGQLYYDMYSTYNYYNYDGSNILGSPYCKGSSDAYRPECHVSAWFKSNGTVSNNVSSSPDFTCADSVKAHCDEIWETGTGIGCNGENHKVPDMLQTGYNVFASYAAEDHLPACAKGIDRISSANVTKMQSCYDEIKSNADDAKKYLYNGFLVLSLTPDENAASDVTSMTLNGKFIFIYESQYGGNQIRFPSTTSSSAVFVYLRHGASGHLQTGTGNYFVFTEESIGGIISGTWNGSMYASAKNCAKISDINGNVTLTYNAAVVTALTEAGVVCEASAATCGGVEESTSTSSASTTTTTGAYDADFIATGAQIGTEMESQYKNTETVNDANSTSIEPSVVVLPRIIYLTKDARGKLSDYYTVIPLNGSSATGNGSVTDCTAGAPPTSGTMVSDENYLEEGYFTCKYTESDAAKTYNSTFYIVVSGVTAETPKVRFEGSTREEINVSTEPTKDVTLFVSGVENASSSAFTVEINVSDAPTGWTITQEETTNMTCSAGTCTYTGTVSSADQEIKLFTVTTSAASKSGNVTFQLQTPQNCTITSPSVRQFVIQGTALITRKSIKAYCETYPDNCTGTNSDYATAADKDDCSSTNTWITADGSGCTVNGTDANNSWLCDAGNDDEHPIKLSAGSYDSRYCTLYLPTDNNEITEAQDKNTKTEGYYLYASLKKKSFSLHVETNGTTKSEVHVFTKESLDADFGSSYTTCSNSHDCDLDLSVNTYVKLAVVVDGDNFSRWLCSGSGCFDDKNSTIPVTFVVSGNSSYTFKFNEKDTHCFYSDFKQTSTNIWCTENEIDCVEHCSSGAPCEVDAGAYSLASWNVINSNSDGYLKPDNSSGYVKYSGSTPVMMMNTVEGGYDGKFSVRLRSGMNAYKKAFGPYYYENTDFLNSGIILRSTKDGKEHFTVNIYGVNATGSDKTISASTHARVCYVKDKFKMDSYDGNVCKDITLTSKNLDLLFEWFAGTSLNFDFTLSGTTLSIHGSYSGTAGLYEAIGEIDLSTLVSGALADDTHSYVGIKLADASFGVYDAAWHSEKFGDECWGDPTVSCSFASKYLGGEVPLATDASPDVAFSSWFASTGESCITNVTYYYNGCDLASGYFSSTLGEWFSNVTYCKNGTGSDGYYQNYLGADGTSLAGSTYNFTYEGKHGYKHSSGSGYVRNASISVNCNSVNGRKYEASCGEFYVGTQTSCSKNVVIVRDATTYSTSSEEIFIGGDEGANLREADIVFDMDIRDDENVSIQMVDKDGNASNTIVIHETGVSTISMNRFADQYGFNPEKVVKVILTGSDTYKVNSIVSSCPYALSVQCNSATYTGTQWKVTASVSSMSQAKKCKLTSDKSGLGTFFGECTSLGEYFLDDADFYKELNTSGGDKQHTFTVSVFDDENATESSDPAATCSVASNEYEPAEITRCELTGSTTVYQGQGIPEIQYSIENCDDYKCDYEILLMSAGTQVKTETDQSDFVDKTFSSTVVNGPATANYLTTGSYNYKVVLFKNINGTKTVFDECPSGSFTVQESTPASGTCDLNVTTGSLKVTLTGAGYGTTAVSLIGTDALGNLLNVSSIDAGSSQETTIDLTQKNLPAGTVLTLDVGGTKTTCGTYPPAASDPDVSLSCPTSISDFESSYSFTPTVTGCDDGCSLSISGGSISPTSSYTSGSITISGITSSGDYTVTATRGSKSGSCTIPITVKESSTLDVDCQIADQSGKAIGSTISVQPHQVTGCNSDCSYSIMQGTETVTSGNNYSGESVSFIDSKATAGTKAYTLKVTDSKNNSESCNFNVAYAASSSTCACATYCGSGCESNIVTGNINDQSFKGCLFVTDASRLSFSLDNGGWWKVNGNSMSINQPCWDNSSDCANALSSYTKVDGGWYIEADVGWASARSSGYNPCAAEETPVLTSCNPATATVAPGKTVTVTPSLSTTCDTKNGCNYAITGDASVSGSYRSGTISFADASATDGSSRTYSLTISNSEGHSASCPITISYDASASTTIDNWTSSNATLTAGTYVINKCSGNSGSKTVQLKTGSSSDCLNWFSPSASWSGGPWGTCNGQVSLSFPVTLIVPAGESITYDGNCW